MILTHTDAPHTLLGLTVEELRVSTMFTPAWAVNLFISRTWHLARASAFPNASIPCIHLEDPYGTPVPECSKHERQRGPSAA